MTLVQASSTASSSLATSSSVKPACVPTAVTNSRMSARFSVEEGTCSVNFRSIEVTSGLLRGPLREAPDGGWTVIHQLVDLVEAEELEHLLHFRDQAADLDVAAPLSDLLDE